MASLGDNTTDPMGSSGFGQAWGELMGGQNKVRIDSYDVDPNAYMYGGQPGFAGQEALRYANQGDTYGNNAGQNFFNANAGHVQQQQLVNQLQQTAAGNGPSAAQAQLTAGLNQANENAQSFANSAKGGPLAQAAAQRQAQVSVANNAQNAANASAQLRAQEQNAALGALGGALQGQRGQDLQAAGVAGQLQQGYEGMRQQTFEDQLKAQMQGQAQQSENYNTAQGLNAQIAEGNATRAGKSGDEVLGIAGSMLGGGVMSDRAVKEDVTPLTLGPGTSHDPENWGPLLRRVQDERARQIMQHLGPVPHGAQRVGTQSGEFGEHHAFEDRAPAEYRAAGAQEMAQNAQSRDVGQAAPSLADRLRAMLPSDFYLKHDVAPLAQSQAHAPLLGPPRYAPGMPNQAAALPPAPTPGYRPLLSVSDENAKSGLAPLAPRRASGIPDPENAKDTAPRVPNISPSAGGDSGSGSSSMMSGVMGGAMSAMSDARVKQGITPQEPAVDDFLSHLHGYAYNYKPGVPNEDPNQRRYGIIAQQVRESPMGSSIIDKTPMGLAIDIPHATGAMLAGEGELYARQRAEQQQIAALREQLRRRFR